MVQVISHTGSYVQRRSECHDIRGVLEWVSRSSSATESGQCPTTCSTDMSSSSPRCGGWIDCVTRDKQQSGRLHNSAMGVAPGVAGVWLSPLWAFALELWAAKKTKSLTVTVVWRGGRRRSSSK